MVGGELSKARRPRSRVLRSLATAAATGALALVTAPAAAGYCEPGTHESVAATADGYQVHVCLSEVYAADPARVQSLGETLGSLMHGAELASLTVALKTPEDVAKVCGSTDALACYGGDRIVLPGELRPGSPPQAYLLAHEYGHHVLAHSRNDPWPAQEWGSKRWASSLGVCAAARQHQLFQGYASMPGEAFAEGFAMQQFPMLHMPWNYVDMLAPDDVTAAAMRSDILQPWTGPTTLSYAGRLARGGTRSLRLRFPLDGSSTFKASGTVRLRLELLAAGKVVARAQPSRSGTRMAFTICGSRQLVARLTALRGSGRYALTVSRP